MQGTTIYQPTWFPSPDIRLDFVHKFADGHRILGVALNYRASVSQWIHIKQFDSPGTLRLPFMITEGIVGSSVAAFYTLPIQVPDEQYRKVNLRGCLWEHEGHLIQTLSRGLSDSELMGVGNSLR